MASYIDMSLEDIIQKKKKISRNSVKPKPHAPTQKLPVIDARNKIISKKRTQITDAREKLAELAKKKDARLKLQQLRAQRQGYVKNQSNNGLQSRGKLNRDVLKKERVFVDSSRQVVSHPLNSSTRISMRQHSNSNINKKFTQNRAIERRTLGKVPLPKPILRTVENDLEIIDDPMGEEVVNTIPLNRKASLQLKITTHNSDSIQNRFSVLHRTALIEKEKSPPRPPSILKKRPMAALRTENKVDNKVEKQALEYRIIVSNLCNTVTGGDIEELFGDVGGMLESRLVRPGTAEVIYKTQEDAQRAVDLYHNRQLDGQPMNCLLVTPRASAPSRNSSKPALYSTNSNVEPDISTFHKVLFSNF